MSKKERQLHYHTWYDDDKSGTYFIRNYNMCHITIIRYNKGEHDPVTREIFTTDQFVPCINGIRLNRIGAVIDESVQTKFDNLDDAKKAAQTRWDLNHQMSMDTKFVWTKRKTSVGD